VRRVHEFLPPTQAHEMQRRFLSVAASALELDVSEVTLYRAIHDGHFPAIKIRGRYVIPAKALEAMERAALAGGAMVDAADWAEPLGNDQ